MLKSGNVNKNRNFFVELCQMRAKTINGQALSAKKLTYLILHEY